MHEAGGLLPETDDGLDCHECREMTSRRDQRAEDAKLRAIVAIVGVERIADEAAVAGTIRFPTAPQADLRLERRGCPADEWDP